ncbi:MAG: hypothetical protein V3V97_14415 [Hyphomicrobiaceae bacterium]
MDWKKFTRTLVATFFGLLLAVATFIIVMNPFGNLPVRVAEAHVIMDINQRFQFPSVVRTGDYDSVVLGTSTSRLLDPAILEKYFGGRFANLAMNDGRAWEQYRLLKLFLETNGPPHTLLFGLDVVWCDLHAYKNRLTKRGFPEWMYDKNPTNDWFNFINGKSLEISFRQLAHRLGFDDPRIPANGFEVFTPPEDQYDEVKAKRKIWGNREPDLAPQVPPFQPDPSMLDGLAFPALVWLEELATRMPAESKVLFVFMPVHVATQPRIGSRQAAIEAECKSRIAEIAQRHGAFVIDFRISSSLTTTDTNYWDALHYRLPIGERIINGIAAASARGGPATDGTWRVLGGSKAD